MIVTLLFVVQILVSLALIGVVLLQKSDGGALGSIGGGGMSGFMTGRSTANLLTRTTAYLAAAFFGLSILLVVLSNQKQQAPRSFLDQGGPPPAGSTAPAPAKPAAPATPAAPSAPLAK